MHKKVAAASNLITEWAHALRRLGETKSSSKKSSELTAADGRRASSTIEEDEEVLTILSASEVLDLKRSLDRVPFRNCIWLCF